MKKSFAICTFILILLACSKPNKNKYGNISNTINKQATSPNFNFEKINTLKVI